MIWLQADLREIPWPHLNIILGADWAYLWRYAKIMDWLAVIALLTILLVMANNDPIINEDDSAGRWRFGLIFYALIGAVAGLIINIYKVMP